MTLTTENSSYIVQEIRTLPRQKILLRAAVDGKKNFFFLKRSFDLVFSLLVVAGILSWFLPLMALLIRLKPGITGLAQVRGLHGPVTDFQTVFCRYQWDAFYVRNANFLMDMRILRWTIRLLFTQQQNICK